MWDVSQFSIKLLNQAWRVCRRVERDGGQKKRDTEERMGNVSFPVLHCDEDLASEHSSLWCPAPAPSNESEKLRNDCPILTILRCGWQPAWQVTLTPLKRHWKQKMVERQCWKWQEAPASFSNNSRIITNDSHLPSKLFLPVCFVSIVFVFVLISVLNGLVCYLPYVFK